MNNKALKTQIEQTAKEADCTELEIISAMQTYCASKGEENTLNQLCEIKWDYI